MIHSRQVLELTPPTERFALSVVRGWRPRLLAHVVVLVEILLALADRVGVPLLFCLGNVRGHRFDQLLALSVNDDLWALRLHFHAPGLVAFRAPFDHVTAPVYVILYL